MVKRYSTFGRKMTNSDRNQIADMLDEGLSVKAISKELGWSISSIYYIGIVLHHLRNNNLDKWLSMQKGYRNDSLIDWAHIRVTQGKSVTQKETSVFQYPKGMTIETSKLVRPSFEKVVMNAIKSIANDLNEIKTILINNNQGGFYA